MYLRCSFSGHRKLNGTDFDGELLERVILDLIKTGTKVFYSGMALGFDMIAAECVIKYKNEYGVKLIACLPCRNQSERFGERNKERYENIIKECDEVVVLSEYYHKGCMFVRNRYLADNCDVLVCFLRNDRGGTSYTVRYAEEKGKNIIYV